MSTEDNGPYGLRGLFDYLGEREGESFTRWRSAVADAVLAEAAVARVQSLADVVRDLQPADPDTHDRDVSWLELLEALDPS